MSARDSLNTLRRITERLKDLCTNDESRHMCKSVIEQIDIELAVAVDPKKCKANPTADPPQDCGFPFCGCFPVVDEAIESLNEMGLLTVIKP